MALTKIDDRGLTTPIDLLDSEKIRFGTGNDLAIYHDGSYNRFTGANYVFMNAAANEYIFEGYENGDVRLYYDNSKKFETTSTGVKYTGDLRADDDYRIKLGTSQELNIYHHNTGSSVIENTNQTLKLRAKAGEDAVVITPDGSVDLYHDNSKKLETHTTGVVVHGNISPDNLYLGDNEKAYFGDGSDLQIYHDGTNSWINNATGALYFKTAASNSVYVLDNNNDTIFRAVDDGATELYYDNSKKLETTSIGSTITGSLTINNSNYDGLIVKNNDDGSNGAYITLINDSASPNNADYAGIVNFRGKDSAGNDTTYGQVRVYTTDVTDGQESGTMTFNVRNSNTFEEKVRILSGGGITFNGDTATQNALDDYEEGEWDLSGSESNVDLNDNFDRGRYIKIGHKVTCWAYIKSAETLTGSTADSTAMTLNLPFATKGQPNTGYVGYQGPCMARDVAFPSSHTQITAGTGGAASVLYFYFTQSDGIWNTLKQSGFPLNRYLHFSFTYHCQ